MAPNPSPLAVSEPQHQWWRFSCRVGCVSVAASAAASAAVIGCPPVNPRQGKAPVLTSHRGLVWIPGDRSVIDLAVNDARSMHTAVLLLLVFRVVDFLVDTSTGGITMSC
jgi:hypothetical protein